MKFQVELLSKPSNTNLFPELHLLWNLPSSEEDVLTLLQDGLGSAEARLSGFLRLLRRLRLQHRYVRSGGRQPNGDGHLVASC